MNAAQVPSELVSIVTAFILSVHHSIETLVKTKNKQRRGKDVYYKYYSPSGLFLCWFTSTTYTSIGEFSLNGVVKLTPIPMKLVLAGEFFESCLLTLSLQNNLSSYPWFCCCWYRGSYFLLIHAVATVHFRADHVVSGTVLNLMAPALAVFLVKVLSNKGHTNDNLSQISLDRLISSFGW